mgnify:CR=1 FL=1
MEWRVDQKSRKQTLRYAKEAETDELTGLGNRRYTAKFVAAKRACAYVESGMKVGLGTGSTAAWMVKCLGEKVAEGLKITGVPTSTRTATTPAVIIPSSWAARRASACPSAMSNWRRGQVSSTRSPATCAPCPGWARRRPP